MIPNVSNFNNPITEKEIEDVEKELNVKLPEGYKKFLLETNGGTPEPELFHISKERGGGIIYEFYNAKRIVTSTQIFWEHDEPCLVVPPTMICIAVTEGDDGYLLGIAEENYNKVFELNYSSICRSDDIGDDEPDIILKADSFEEFLNSFCTHEEFKKSIYG